MLIKTFFIKRLCDQASVGLSTGIHRRDATASNEPWIQDLMAIMDILADKGPAILIASSNGAQICCHVAKVRPQQVKGLVLIGEICLTMK